MSQRPLYNILAKSKDDKSEPAFQIGAIWPGKFDGTVNLQFGARNKDGSERTVSDALKIINSGKYWINGVTPGAGKSKQRDQAEEPGDIF